MLPAVTSIKTNNRRASSLIIMVFLSVLGLPPYTCLCLACHLTPVCVLGVAAFGSSQPEFLPELLYGSIKLR